MKRRNGQRLIGTTGRNTACAAILLALVVLIGCAADGKFPLEPQAPLLPAGNSGPGHAYPAYPDDHPETIDNVVKTGITISSSVLVTAALGGVVVAGRHTLTIPPGALDQDTFITLKDQSGKYGWVCCECYPEGLKFGKPATLTTTCRDLTELNGLTIYWVENPGDDDERWLDIGATPSFDGLGLTVRLQHFSTYAPGKAGWGPRRGGESHLKIND